MVCGKWRDKLIIAYCKKCIQFLTTRSEHTKTILKEGLVVESSSYTYNLFMPIF